jgi:hypothetical protein
MDKIEQGYINNLKMLKDISYNDKVILDYIDCRKTHLPIFITNPSPGLIVEPGFKVQVLHYYTQRNVKNNQLYNNLVKSQPHKARINTKKEQVSQIQENIYLYVNMLKEKLNCSINNAYKYIDEKK